MASRAARYQAQAAAAATAAARVATVSAAAALEDSIADVTGGGSDTIQALRDEIDALDVRLQAVEP